MTSEEPNVAAVAKGQAGRKRLTAEEREGILKVWAASGKSAEEFAAQSGWSHWTLLRWRTEAARPTRRRTEDPRGANLLVAVPAPARSVWAAEVMTRSGTVRLAGSASPAWAGQLIRELSRC